MGKKIITFYEYMMHYPHKRPARQELAAAMKKAAQHNPGIKRIDSMVDMYIAFADLGEVAESDKATGGLWYEYCTITGRPLL